MIHEDDDDDYQIDAQGNRVLIGLSLEETEEFQRLEETIANSCPRSQIGDQDWALPEDQRWTEMFEEHETAKRPFLNIDYRIRH
jgi:hypothetical protein